MRSTSVDVRCDRLKGADSPRRPVRHEPLATYTLPAFRPATGGPLTSGGASVTTATVTVLFCDIAGSTDLLTRLGEEAGEHARRSYFRALRNALEDHAGSEIKSLGDGLMATFPSASDAVASAIEMQRNIARLNRREPALELGLRVGISHGEATAEDDDWFGTPIVEASRLCEAAAPGQVLASDIVRAVARRRHGPAFASVGAVPAKGLPGGVDAVEVAWIPPDPDESPLPAPLAASVSDVFVGRTRELDELQRAWKSAVAGERFAVLLGGEPGIGKTRLAAEMARLAHAEAGVILHGHCDEGLAVPYQPFAAALRPLLAEFGDADLAAAVGDDGPHLARLLPELGPRLSVTPAAASDPDSDRFLLFEAVTRALAAASEHNAILLVLDDLHWASKPTLLLLRHVLRSEIPMKVMVLGTYRDTDLDPGHPLADLLADLRRDGGADRLLVEGLGVDDVEDFVAAASGFAADDRMTAFAAALHDETDGNPFFVKEVLAHLAETGRLRDHDDLTGGGAHGVTELPDSVREVVGRRLARLSPAAQQALTVAAVVGRSFAPSFLERVAEAGDPDRVLDALDEAVQAQLVVDAGGGRLEFVHAIVRHALYGGLTSARRMRLHGRVGEALEAGGRAHRQAAVLAMHFAEAAADGYAEQAARYGLDAALDALARSAFEEALDHLERSLASLEMIDDPDRALRLEVLITLAETHTHHGSDWEACRVAAVAAAEDARAVGSADGLARAAAAATRFFPVGGDAPDVIAIARAACEAPGVNPGLRARVMSGIILAGLAHHLGDLDAVSQEAVALAEQSDDVAAMSVALTARGFVLHHFGRARECLEIGDRAVHLVDASFQGPILHSGLYERARARLALGDVAGFNADTEELEQAAERMRGQYGFWAVNHRIVHMLISGDFAAAEAAAITALADVRHANDQFLCLAQIMVAMWEQGRFSELVPAITDVAAGQPSIMAFGAGLAAIAAEAGEFDVARSAFERTHASGAAGLPPDATWLGGVALLAQAAAHLGAVDAAADLTSALEPHSGTLVVVASAVAAIGAADRYLGMLAALRGDDAEAAERYDAALALETAAGSRPLMTRTKLWRARLHGSAELAAEVTADADALGMAGVAAQARELL